MLDFIFQKIHDRIKDQVPEVNSVQVYQQQDIFQSKSLGYKPPVVFVEFVSPITYSDLSINLQEGEMSINIKVVFEEYTKNYLKVLSFKKKIVQALNGWSEWQYPLTRISESPDTTADTLYVYDIEFTTTFFEDLAEEQCPQPYEIEFSLLMNSNQDDTYTDWNGTSGTSHPVTKI